MVYLEFPSVTIASLLRFIVAYGRSSHGSRPKDKSLPNRSVRARVFRCALAGKDGRLMPFESNGAVIPGWQRGVAVDGKGTSNPSMIGRTFRIGRSPDRSTSRRLAMTKGRLADRATVEKIPRSGARPTRRRFSVGRAILPCHLSVDRLR
jgi:hypothetical protein